MKKKGRIKREREREREMDGWKEGNKERKREKGGEWPGDGVFPNKSIGCHGNGVVSKGVTPFTTANNGQQLTLPDRQPTHQSTATTATTTTTSVVIFSALTIHSKRQQNETINGGVDRSATADTNPSPSSSSSPFPPFPISRLMRRANDSSPRR